jgi:hypothetical protein
VAVGAIARSCSRRRTEIISHVASIGSAALPDSLAITYERAYDPADAPLHCADPAVRAVDDRGDRSAAQAGEATMGGSFR